MVSSDTDSESAEDFAYGLLGPIVRLSLAGKEIVILNEAVDAEELVSSPLQAGTVPH